MIQFDILFQGTLKYFHKENDEMAKIQPMAILENG
jgi:hypothetical protein